MDFGYVIGCIFVGILFLISIAFFFYLLYDAYTDWKKLKGSEKSCKNPKSK